MQTIDCIKSRRSRRKFLDKPVEDSIINKILELAVTAPSSVDCQPWHFIVIKNKETIAKIAALKDEDNQLQFKVPVLIIVCVDTEKSPSRHYEDGHSATHNIIFAAHELGLGSVYMSGAKQTQPEIADQLRVILNLPESIVPINILPIGYPDPKEILDNKDLLNIKDIIHYDKW